MEFCAFVTNDETGCSCAVYRSLEKRMIAVSFRGTCAPKDLITDASILQTTWVEGEDAELEGVPMVHVGFRYVFALLDSRSLACALIISERFSEMFSYRLVCRLLIFFIKKFCFNPQCRNSLNSISRRLKELILAAVAPGEDLSYYQRLITGHSLGGALATLFATDIAEYGMDAGRGLPQLEPSEPWWNAVINRFTSFSSGDKIDKTANGIMAPPRPKTLKLYSFGSPRVGNEAFVKTFDSLQQSGKLDEAYRVVNGADVVARLPRSVNFVLKVGYDHCGATALISLPKTKKDGDEQEGKESGSTVTTVPLIWVEGESGDSMCPVRDGTPLTSPLAEGMLLGDLFNAVKNVTDSPEGADKELIQASYISKLGEMAGKLSKSVAGRFQTFTAADLTSIFGIDKKYAEREATIIQSVVSGEAIAHHLEDEYYGAMGRACGFIALVGEPLIAIKDSDEWTLEMESLGEIVLQHSEKLENEEKASNTEFDFWTA